jgi:hypothetical protein
MKYIVVVCTILYGVSYLFPFLIKIFEIWKNEESLTNDKIYYKIYRVISVGSTLILTSHLCVGFPGQYFIYFSFQPRPQKSFNLLPRRWRQNISLKQW